MKSYWSLLIEQLKDFNYMLLMIFATITLFAAFYDDSKYAFLESFSIYFAVLLASLATAGCIYTKNSQFLSLKEEIQNEECKVMRGPMATTQNILVKDLVVGDIVVLEAGDKVPADCVLVKEMDMFVDQSFLYHGETNMEKQCSNDGVNDDQNPDAILYAGSSIMAGAGHALVCCVGQRTIYQKENPSFDMEEATNMTPLETKLSNLEKVISRYA
mmetsp:Transcript_19201/g.13801  ORF Transcript_19201/g.13801 Transcript_19201/m.13801 type:complete len:215 (+) Transcript_19201:315-959(+)|eukprot:CAMPEP_0116880274 /NCGR_PEP_ID=MMETSP0463-20121206/12181_1 /TAXON_ID=181622 /ORGANISM="Strombidinopsis sp, Strain SopsisLIS2011" /LENGTH=214 /DNA_ID=CAMNT_0004530645 /DNA_START=240 /DNA_END=884 /DNA_ORIENTATION=+